MADGLHDDLFALQTHHHIMHWLHHHIIQSLHQGFCLQSLFTCSMLHATNNQLQAVSGFHDSATHKHTHINILHVTHYSLHIVFRRSYNSVTPQPALPSLSPSWYFQIFQFLLTNKSLTTLFEARANCWVTGCKTGNSLRRNIIIANMYILSVGGP